MAVDAASLRSRREPARAWLSTRAVLLAAGCTSAAVTAVFAFQRATTRYFPDEFIYPQLARSIAEGRGIRVLAEHSTLPTLLEPLMTAGAWLPGDPALAFRLTQALHVVVMALAVVPVYRLARHLGLGGFASVFSGLVAVVSPSLLYAGYATADALGYTLALAALAAGVEALASPSTRTQSALLAFAGLASFARLQYAVLVPAFLVTALLVERGSARLVARRFPIVVGVVAAVVVAGTAFGSGALGRYGVVSAFAPSTEAVLWVSRSAFLLCLAAGVAIVPGAVAWLASRRRATTPERRAFAWLVLVILSALLVVAALMAVETTSERFFERYLMVALPLLALAYGCWVEDGRPGRRVAIATVAVLLAASARLPVSAYTVGQGPADSPFLLAIRRLEAAIGVDDASLLVAAAAGVGLLVAGWSILGRHRAVTLAAAATLAALCAVSVGARLEDLALSRSAAARMLGTERGWVDASGARDVLLLQTARSPSSRAMSQAFWNTSVTGGALLGTAVPMDGAAERALVGPDGTLSVAGRPVTRPLLVATSGSRVVFANARVVDSAPGFSLVRPRGAARLALLAEGVASDGWLAAASTITLWPDRGHPRVLRMRLSLPAGREPVTLALREGRIRRVVRIRPGGTQTVELRSSASAPPRIEIAASRSFGVGGMRLVAARVSSIELVDGP
jgi:Dolichyl-phosphate-mannose-protein mannosyltransferase